MVGGGKGLLCRCQVAKKSVDQHIVRHFVPNCWRGRCESVFDLRDPGQFLIVDCDRFGGVLRLRCGLRDHDHDRFADMAHLVRWQQHLRADKDRAAARTGQFHVIAGLRHRVVRDRREPVSGAIASCKDADDPGQPRRLLLLDPEDTGVRIWRTHNGHIGLARQREIIAEAAAAGQQALVFLAAQRPANCAKALQVRQFDYSRVVHASPRAHS